MLEVQAWLMAHDATAAPPGEADGGANEDDEDSGGVAGAHTDLQTAAMTTVAAGRQQRSWRLLHLPDGRHASAELALALRGHFSSGGSPVAVGGGAGGVRRPSP
jgi:hypothetical protein